MASLVAPPLWLQSDLLSFTITCDFVIKEVVREDGTTDAVGGSRNLQPGIMVAAPGWMVMVMRAR